MVNNFNYSSLRVNAFLFLLLLIPSFSYAQDSLLIESPYTDFSVDPVGNLYTVSGNDVLTKIIETDDFQIESYEYSNRALGAISNFETSNPLKVIVNHADFSTLVLLDVTLRETARIYLPDLQIYSNPVAYTLATDNTVWLYDDVNANLVRINQAGERIFETQNLIQEVDFAPQIIKLQSNRNYLVAYDPVKGFLIFDQYGAFIKQIPILALADFQLVENQLLYAKEQTVYSYSLAGLLEQKIAELPDLSPKFHLFQDRLFFLNFLGVGEMNIVAENQQ